MKLFVFYTIGAYGLCVRGVIHTDINSAFEFSNAEHQSLSSLGWEKELAYVLTTDKTEAEIVFDLF